MNPAKFLSDKIVDALSTLELGACLRLLCRQWIDGDIPDDLELLARHCRLAEAEMQRAWSILSGFFPVVGPGKRANRYMWIEREKVIADLERKSDEGTRLARKRWDDVKNKRNAAGNANGSAASNPASTVSGMSGAVQEQIGEEKSRKEQTREEGSRVGAVGAGLSDEMVSLIWHTYPKNHHRADQIHIPKADADPIIEAIARDGEDFVLGKTALYAAATAQWQPHERNFILATDKFYRAFEYRKDPREWERTSIDGRRRSKAEQLVDDQIAARNEARRAFGVDR